VSRRRWSVRWRIPPPRAPSALPAPRPLPRPALRTRMSIIDDLRRPLFAARGKLCASADLRPRGFGLCAATRPAPSSPRATPPPAASCRSTLMAAACLTCIPAGTHCRKACARCLGQPRPNPQRQNLSLPWCRRHVRHLRHDHYVERTVVIGGIRETRSSRRPSNLDICKYIP
jgi:hypothetical protein